MSGKLDFSSDVIMHIRDGQWFLSNMKTLTHIKMDMESFTNLNNYISNADDKSFLNKKFEIIDSTAFTNLDGLMEEPTHLDSSKELIVSGFESVIKSLKKSFILIEDKREYLDYFKPKESFFDRKHYGTFHQQMGYSLLTSKRVTPDEWWPTQKFTEEWEIKNNLYRYIQLNFFKNYFNRDFAKGKKILDLGCGVGFYSKILLENGADIIGIDPNADYIAKAKANCLGIGSSDFRVGILKENSDILSEEEKFDIIIISDMLLFYFSPPNPNDEMNPVALLKLVRKYLKDDGVLYITEPHSFFWLAPWLGDEDNPFTVLTEYSEKNYSVTPTLSQITDAFSKAGLCINEIYEPLPSADCETNYSKRAYHFAKKFPLWWVFILGKRD